MDRAFVLIFFTTVVLFSAGARAQSACGLVGNPYSLAETPPNVLTTCPLSTPYFSQQLTSPLQSFPGQTYPMPPATNFGNFYGTPSPFSYSRTPYLLGAAQMALAAKYPPHAPYDARATHQKRVQHVHAAARSDVIAKQQITEQLPQLPGTTNRQNCDCSLNQPAAPPDTTVQSDLDQCKVHEVQNLPGSGQFASHFLENIVSDPDDPNTMYGISSDLSSHVTPASKQAMYVSKSSDGGKTWHGIARIPEKSSSQPPQRNYNANLMEGLHNGIAVSGGKIVITTQEGAMELSDPPKTIGDDEAVLTRLPGPTMQGDSDYAKEIRKRGGTPSSDYTKLNGDPVAAGAVKLCPDKDHMIVSYGYYDHDPRVVAYKKENGQWVEDAAKKFPPGPYGRHIMSLDCDPQNKNSVYIGTGEQPYRYDPASKTWKHVGGFGEDAAVSSINTIGGLHMTSCWQVAVPSKAPGARADSVTIAHSPSFIWKNSKPDASGHFGNLLRAYNIEVNPQHHEQMAVTSASGVYTTKDGGKTWSRLEGLPQCVSANVKVPGVNNVDPAQCARLTAQRAGQTTGKGAVDPNLYLADYRTAHFGPDGTLVVSGTAGTFVTNAFADKCSSKYK